MSKFTDFLNLFMWDSVEDSEEEFNIDKALNDNWKKIDTKVKTHVNSVNEEVNNFKTEVNQKIDNIQALPTGGAKGQVLTKQSETEGDATWEDIEANEVFIGNTEEAPETAKIIIEKDDFGESSTLGKSEVYVGTEEPLAGEKVWFKNDDNSIYVRNSNGVYEEFTKKEISNYSYSYKGLEINATKNNNIVTLTINGSLTEKFLKNTFYDIEIDSNITPNVEVNDSIYTSANIGGMIRIATNNKIRIYPWSDFSSGLGIRYTLTYLI